MAAPLSGSCRCDLRAEKSGAGTGEAQPPASERDANRQGIWRSLQLDAKKDPEFRADGARGVVEPLPANEASSISSRHATFDVMGRKTAHHKIGLPRTCHDSATSPNLVAAKRPLLGDDTLPLRCR